MKQETVQKKDTQPQHQAINRTGIPAQMKLDFERRSGLSFDDVRVHYHSDKPAKIGALAYTQGNQVHIGPGQERHLRHELGHVVQQKRGLVYPTGREYGIPVNQNPYLEQQASQWGAGGAIPSGAAQSNAMPGIVQKQPPRKRAPQKSTRRFNSVVLSSLPVKAGQDRRHIISFHNMNRKLDNCKAEIYNGSEETKEKAIQRILTVTRYSGDLTGITVEDAMKILLDKLNNNLANLVVDSGGENRGLGRIMNHMGKSRYMKMPGEEQRAEFQEFFIKNRPVEGKCSFLDLFKKLIYNVGEKCLVDFIGSGSAGSIGWRYGAGDFDAWQGDIRDILDNASVDIMTNVSSEKVRTILEKELPQKLLGVRNFDDYMAFCEEFLALGNTAQ